MVVFLCFESYILQSNPAFLNVGVAKVFSGGRKVIYKILVFL